MALSIDIFRDMLGWCTVINFGLLLWWALFFMAAHDWTYRLHTRWFRLTVERFDTIHYTGMAFFKVFILLFNLVPYLALRLVGWTHGI
jgi:hypothetical protein